MQANGSHVYFAITLHRSCNYPTAIFNNFFALTTWDSSALKHCMRPAHWQKIRHPKQPEILAFSYRDANCLTNHQPIPLQLYGTVATLKTELMQTRAMAAEIPSPPACEFFFENLKTITHHPTDGLSLVFPLPASANMPKAFSSDVSRFLSHREDSHLRKKTQVAAHSLPSAHQNVAIILQHIHCMCKYLQTRINGNHAVLPCRQLCIIERMMSKALSKATKQWSEGHSLGIWQNLVAFSVYKRYECELKTQSAKKAYSTKPWVPTSLWITSFG